jgi:hypothetical protein
MEKIAASIYGGIVAFATIFTHGKTAMLDAERVAARPVHSFAGDYLAHQGAAEDAVIETREADIELGGRTIDGLPGQGKAWHEEDPDCATAKLREGKGWRSAHVTRSSEVCSTRHACRRQSSSASMTFALVRRWCGGRGCDGYR